MESPWVRSEIVIKLNATALRIHGDSIRGLRCKLKNSKQIFEQVENSYLRHYGLKRLFTADVETALKYCQMK